MKPSIKNHLGYDGILCQTNKDQGDSAQREGLYAVLSKLNGDEYDIATDETMSLRYHTVMNKLQTAPGVYRRNSDPSHWGSNPTNFTRDQRGMLELAMGAMGDLNRLRQSGAYLLKRCGFHQNTRHGTDNASWKIPDIVSPGELANFARHLLGNISYIPNILLDLGLILDVLTRSKWDGANMCAVNIMSALVNKPTPAVYVAWKLLKKTEYKEEIRHYYSNDGGLNGLPPLGDYYLTVINKFEGKYK